MSWGAFAALPEDEQALWREKHEREQNRCSKCHSDRETCSDPEHEWFPQRSVCYADMTQAAADALYDELHDAEKFHDGTFANWSTTRSKDFPFHFRDGVSIWVAPVDLNPDDKFTTDKNATPRGGARGD